MKGKTKKSALLAPWINDYTHDQLVELLLTGRNRQDTDRRVIEELGFGVGAWNGRSAISEQAGLSISCGIYDDARGRISNAVVLNLPRDLSFLETDEEDRITELLLAHIDPWNPDWIVAAARQKGEARDGSTEWITLPMLLWQLPGAKPRERNFIGDAEVSSVAGGQLSVSPAFREANQEL